MRHVMVLVSCGTITVQSCAVAILLSRQILYVVGHQ